MRDAFIVKETQEYAMVVFLVFASSEKEARTTLFNSGKSLRCTNPKAHCEVIKSVQALHLGEDVIELAEYYE
jgi:hypothetical protein